VLASWGGLEGAFLVGLFFVGALSACGTLCDFRAGQRARFPAILLAALLPLIPVVAGMAGPGWDLPRLLSGVYQWPADALLNRNLDDPERKTLFIGEGREVIVSVERIGNTVYVKGNGKVEGTVPADLNRGSSADLPTQLLLGVLPGLLRAGEPAAIIGLGSGTTLGAAHRAGLHPIDLLEIEPQFALALGDRRTRTYFAPFLAGILDGPDVTQWFGDARSLLAGPLSERRWEVLVSQPSEPWIPSAAPLFTREFFARAAGRTTETGIFLQWVQLYKLSLPALELLVRTFRSQFERVFVLRPPLTGGLILVGARGPLRLDALPAAAGRLERSCRGILSAMGMEVPEDVLAAFLIGPDGVDEWVGPGRGLALNTDDRCELQLLLSSSLHQTEDLTASNLRAIQVRGGDDPISRYLGPGRRDLKFLRLLAARNIRLGDFWEARAILEGDGSPEAESLRGVASREMKALGGPAGSSRNPGGGEE
jgi:spermidine synthase